MIRDKTKTGERLKVLTQIKESEEQLEQFLKVILKESGK
jgi:hypothetical protein